MNARSRFHDELEHLERELSRIGDLAARAVGASVDALIANEDDASRAVIEGDDPIDRGYLDLDQELLSLLALQAPVAADLRLVSVLIHAGHHIERIGDQAVNIAKIQLATSRHPSSAPILQQLNEMGGIVVAMVHTAMDAFRRRDLDACLSLPETDDPVDRLNRNMHFEVAKLAGDRGALAWGLHMNLVARALERVGDNAVDIGEQVAFLITGEHRECADVSHASPPGRDGER